MALIPEKNPLTWKKHEVDTADVCLCAVCWHAPKKLCAE
jgi:hypothetical protein